MVLCAQEILDEAVVFLLVQAELDRSGLDLDAGHGRAR